MKNFLVGLRRYILLFSLVGIMATLNEHNFVGTILCVILVYVCGKAEMLEEVD